MTTLSGMLAAKWPHLYPESAANQEIATAWDITTVSAAIRYFDEVAADPCRKFNDTDYRVGPVLKDIGLTWLRSYTGDFKFLINLREKYNATLELSEAQWAAVLNCMLSDARLAQTPTLPVDKLPACKVTIPIVAADGSTVNVKLVVDRPGPRTRWHGWVFVKSHRPEYRQYTVNADGRHIPNFDRWGNAGRQAEVALKKLCADPLGVIRASGHLTNRCGICNRELSDPESVRLGIGPVCLKKTQHGLALGNFGPQVSPAAPVVPVVPTPAPVAPAPAPPTYSEEEIREAIREALTEDGLMAPEKPAAPLRTLAEVLAERDAREAETPVEAVSEAVPVERPRQARSVATRPRKNRAARE